jgi:hypothetical protein
VVVPVAVAVKSSSDGTRAKAVEAAIVESSNDGAGATVKAPGESATVKTAAAKAASVEATAATTKAATTKAAAPVSTTTTATATAASTAACLCTRRKQRPSQQGRCQYHRRSSCSH